MLPKFEYDTPLQGFDSTVTPDWFMVPLGKKRQIYLRYGDGLDVTSANPAIAGIGYVDPIFGAFGANGRRIISIEGKMHGRTFIQVRKGNFLVAQLEVAVKKLKEVRLAFNFVADNAGHQTTRNSSDVDNWLAELNLIYTPQTNIQFVKNSVRAVTVKKNLGNVVQTSVSQPRLPELQSDWYQVVAQRDKSAPINLFFVWELESDKTPLEDNVEGSHYEKNCLIEDDLSADLVKVIAHELGHALGVPGESHYYKRRNADGMMYYRAEPGLRIGKVHANMMNR